MSWLWLLRLVLGRVRLRRWVATQSEEGWDDLLGKFRVHANGVLADLGGYNPAAMRSVSLLGLDIGYWADLFAICQFQEQAAFVREVEHIDDHRAGLLFHFY